MLDQAKPAAVIIATPTHLHAGMVRQALERGIHVFCEKPLVTDPAESAALTELAAERRPGDPGRLPQPVRGLVPRGAAGCSSSAPSDRSTPRSAEAYGPVVLKPSGHAWRSQRTSGGGSLYDYAAHPLNLLTWYLGEPIGVSGGALTSIFSAQIDDAVAATLHYPSRHRAAVRELVRRVAAQDDDQDHAVGDPRPDLRGPAGDPGLSAGHGADSRRLPRRAGTSATPPT